MSVHNASTRAVRGCLSVMASALVGLCVTAGPAHSAPKKVKAPAAGVSCSPLQAVSKNARGARFDCVKNRTKAQWQPRGSRLNPLGWNEAAIITTEYASWQITVTSVTPDVTARVLAVDGRNVPPAPGSQLVGLNLALTYVGAKDSEVVRQGVSMLALSGDASKPSGRWASGATTEDDCWSNETVTKNTTKNCMMPFEVVSSQMPGLLFYAAKVVGTPVAYYLTKG